MWSWLMPQTENLMWYLGESSAWAGRTASSMTLPLKRPEDMAELGNPVIMAIDPIIPAFFRNRRRPVYALFILAPSVVWPGRRPWLEASFGPALCRLCDRGGGHRS